MLQIGGSLLDAAEQIGLRTLAVKIHYDRQDDKPGLRQFPLPAIAHWRQNHFVVIYKINGDHIWIADPAHGKIKMMRKDFLDQWLSDGDRGVVLGLEPIPGFQRDIFSHKTDYKGWSHLFQYLKIHRKLLFQFVLGLMAGLIIQAIFPFLSQTLIDMGILRQDIHFVWVILIAQLVLFLSQASVQFIQSWILLHIGRRINVSMISDFLMKLIRLPLGFFDSKNIGDLIQRIQDNNRVESFLTGNVLTIIFSIASFLVFSVILLLFKPVIFLVFIAFSSLYFYMGVPFHESSW